MRKRASPHGAAAAATTAMASSKKLPTTTSSGGLHAYGNSYGSGGSLRIYLRTKASVRSRRRRRHREKSKARSGEEKSTTKSSKKNRNRQNAERPIPCLIQSGGFRTRKGRESRRRRVARCRYANRARDDDCDEHTSADRGKQKRRFKNNRKRYSKHR